MGLDIALGILVLVAGLRGWFRGFLLQLIQLGALVGCVYVAEPLRDLARPYARQYVSGVQPEVLDKLLWWSAAVVTYLVGMAMAGMLIKVYKRKTFEEFDSNRGDQGLGFLVGALKGAVVAAFLTAGINAYAAEYLRAEGWVAKQVETSRGLAWSAQYQPAKQIWNSGPVQAFVRQVRSCGLGMDVKTPALTPEAEGVSTARPEPEGRTASRPAPGSSPLSSTPRPPRLALPKPPSLNPRDPDFVISLDRELQREGLHAAPGAVDR
jgi:uncharacterized membrane protein required for colicin V production